MTLVLLPGPASLLSSPGSFGSGKGSGFIAGSGMSGQTIFAALGAILLAGGVVLAWRTREILAELRGSTGSGVGIPSARLQQTRRPSVTRTGRLVGVRCDVDRMGLGCLACRISTMRGQSSNARTGLWAGTGVPSVVQQGTTGMGAVGDQESTRRRGAKRWRERLVSVPVELGELGAVREMAKELQQVNR